MKREIRLMALGEHRRDLMPAGYVVRLEDPRQDEVIRMLSALDAYLESLYPPQSNHLLDVESLCAPNIRFFVARRGADPIGCGALRVEAGYGEVKRMFVARRRAARTSGARFYVASRTRLRAKALR